ncbi:MAG: hypothetical protein SWE60_08310 [Thermodesulfobacteriota bacterium]|nr:hypothetical protein [Thermodesulfobacteriota bacterium]
MITKRHIRRYLDTLSSGVSYEDGQMPDHVWQQLHEYLVSHYKRLDHGARAYADGVFDQLDLSLKERIDSLREGRNKKVLNRKLAIVRGERCPIPTLYLDTPVIESIIRQGLGQSSLGGTGGNAEALYREIRGLVRDGRLVYPEDTFHRETLEMGDAQALEGLEIMKRLSKGLSFRHGQTIEDFQVFRALRGFIDGKGSMGFRRFWQDAFDKQTVSTIMKRRSSVAFEGALALKDPQGKTQEPHQGPPARSTRLRIRYDETALREEHALQKRSSRHLRDLVRLGMRYKVVKEGARKRHLDGFWAGQKTDLSISLWNHYGGTPEGVEGLLSFYESELFSDIPAIGIKREIWDAISVNYPEGLGRPTASPDVSILGAVLPYTDIAILGPKMTEVVRDMLRLDARFDTDIYSMEEHDEILGSLKEVAVAL